MEGGATQALGATTSLRVLHSGPASRHVRGCASSSENSPTGGAGLFVPLASALSSADGSSTALLPTRSGRAGSSYAIPVRARRCWVAALLALASLAVSASAVLYAQGRGAARGSTAASPLPGSSGARGARRSDLDVALAVFRPGKRYYYMSKGGDFCAGMQHWGYSWLCAAAEAQLLNRTLVLEPGMCLPKVHEGQDVVRPLAAYYDVEHVARHVDIIPRDTLSAAYDAYSRALRAPVPTRRFSLADPTSKLLAAAGTPLVIRDLGEQGMGSRVCTQKQPALTRDYSLLKPHPSLQAIIDAIADALARDYDAVHVRRGDKLDPLHWPNLSSDTQPSGLLRKLPKFVAPGRTLYIATNEQQPGFFAPLEGLYRVRVLDDFAHLWNKTSEWHATHSKILGAAPKFDSRMRAIVDGGVLGLARRKVETFNDLTADHRHGTNWKLPSPAQGKGAKGMAAAALRLLWKAQHGGPWGQGRAAVGQGKTAKAKGQLRRPLHPRSKAPLRSSVLQQVAR